MTDIKTAKARSKGLAQSQQSVFDLIKSRKDNFRAVLPQGQNAERFVSACLIAVKMNPKLQHCKAESLIKAMMESARFGLEPNSPLSEAALVPYGDKVEFLIEYRGLLRLAWNSGMIHMIDYDKICKNDEYIYIKGFDSQFSHTPLLSGDRGDPVAYYAYAEIKGGGKAMILMSRDDIVKHMKQFSKSYNASTSPWKTDFDAMAIKTVLRQLVDKKLPKSTTPESVLLAQAAHRDDIPDRERHYVDLDTDNEIGPTSTKNTAGNGSPALKEQPEDFNKVATGEVKPVKESPVGTGFAYKDAKSKNEENGDLSVLLPDYLKMAEIYQDQIAKKGGDAGDVFETVTGSREITDDVSDDKKLETLKSLQENLSAL